MLYQTLSHTLKLAPHERPSSQPLTKNPQQLCYFLCQTLTKDPQQVWQTLKNFDYPTPFSILNQNIFILDFFHVLLPSWQMQILYSLYGIYLEKLTLFFALYNLKEPSDYTQKYTFVLIGLKNIH